jgi:hypothetical protein
MFSIVARFPLVRWPESDLALHSTHLLSFVVDGSGVPRNAAPMAGRTSTGAR